MLTNGRAFGLNVPVNAGADTSGGRKKKLGSPVFVPSLITDAMVGRTGVGAATGSRSFSHAPFVASAARVSTSARRRTHPTDAPNTRTDSHNDFPPRWLFKADSPLGGPDYPKSGGNQNYCVVFRLILARSANPLLAAETVCLDHKGPVV